MEEKATVVFNIYGGNNQIVPNATVQKQVSIGDLFARNCCGARSTQPPS